MSLAPGADADLEEKKSRPYRQDAISDYDWQSMTARLRQLSADIAETFWLVPALLVLFGIVGAMGIVSYDRSGSVPDQLLENWLYDGGAAGARTLLGTIAASTISVAGTAFSITIAALSLAAGQMGPRLLRNFTRDRGNQVTLGVFLGTFCYALIVLRSVRTSDEGAFVPHLALSISIALAFACVGMLVYFVGHMAGRINVDTVIDLVSDDLHAAIKRLTTDAPPSSLPAPGFWDGAQPISDRRRGYLQQLDEKGLAAWANERRVSIRLLVRPGDYIFTGAPVALVKPQTEGVEEAIQNATAIGSERVSSSDLRYAVRQLVEVAVRALSPGINDPNTAIGVLDRLGAALCEIKPLHLPTGVTIQNDRVVLVVPHVQYDELVNTMLHMIRQNAAGKPSILIRQIEVLTQVVTYERNPDRLLVLRRHADLVLADAQRDVQSPADWEDIQIRHKAFIQRYNGL